LLDECGIGDIVELSVADNRITISALDAPRAGWAEAAQQMAARGEDGLLDPVTATAFDESDWQRGESHWTSFERSIVSA
jgi:antitoxin MazE